MAGWLQLGFTTSLLLSPVEFPAYISFMQICLINLCIPGAPRGYLLGKYHSSPRTEHVTVIFTRVISTVGATCKSASLQKLFTLPEFKSWILAAAGRAAFAGWKDQSQPWLFPLPAHGYRTLGSSRTPSLRTWGLDYELPQNNHSEDL